MKTMKVTLKNDFHNTAATVMVPDSGVLSLPATRRAERKLCGIPGCICGAIRGTQDGLPDGYCVDQYSHPDRITIVPVD
jgi:hypothetical protein